MRVVVQRVASASVEVKPLNFLFFLLLFMIVLIAHLVHNSNFLQVEGCMVSAIGPGLLVLVGLHESDVDSDADYM